MKCQILFPAKNKKNILKCCLLKILPRGQELHMLSEWYMCSFDTCGVEPENCGTGHSSDPHS